ncbi:MAG: aldo/keto reductase [Acidimicrobiia bacterium]
MSGAPRALGTGGLVVPPIGLGCMVMSTAYGDADEAEAMATLDEAVERGFTFWDTSDRYALGANEELLGRWLAGGKRDRITLASKFGLVGSEGAELLVDNDPDTIRAACEGSLRRLGTDRIDLYYAHRLDPGVPVEETVGVMAELVAAGKVRFLGLSEVSPDELRRAQAVHPISALQSEWSLVERCNEEDVFPTARALGVGIVPYSPLGRGFLAGALQVPADTLDAGDFRRVDPRFSAEALPANLALFEVVRALAAAKGATPVQVSLAWLLAQGDDVVPIPGIQTRAILDEDLGALDVELDDEDLALLDRTFAPGQVVGGRPYSAIRSESQRRRDALA